MCPTMALHLGTAGPAQPSSDLHLELDVHDRNTKISSQPALSSHCSPPASSASWRWDRTPGPPVLQLAVGTGAALTENETRFTLWQETGARESSRVLCWLPFLNALARSLPRIWHQRKKRRLIQKKYLDSARSPSPSSQLEGDRKQTDGC